MENQEPLFPPATAQEKHPLKEDFNYHFMVSDVEIDQQAREGHGWVRPRPDGLVAKCGGTAIFCGVCRRESELLEGGYIGSPPKPPVGD